jgi:hypothetical protein
MQEEAIARTTAFVVFSALGMERSNSCARIAGRDADRKTGGSRYFFELAEKGL